MFAMFNSPILTAVTRGVSIGGIVTTILGLAIIAAIVCIVLAANKRKNLPKAHESASTTERVEQLTQLKELLDSGAITQEEFDQKKKEFLNL